jgi:hypothetical protein
VQTWLNTLFSLLVSKEFWAAIVGAVVGGLMTLWAALWAQKQAAKEQRELYVESERRAVNATLKAIEAELEVYETTGLAALVDTLAQRDEIQRQNLDAGPLAVMPINRHMFAVFESNMSTIGKIGNDDLRREIIDVYGSAGALVDILNFNQTRVDLWFNPVMAAQRVNAQQINELTRLETMIRNGFDAHRPEVGNLIANIRKYLDA